MELVEQLLWTEDCSHLVCFCFMYILVLPCFNYHLFYMLRLYEKLSEWRFFVYSSNLWSSTYFFSLLFICAVSSLLFFNLTKQWVVDFLGPSMLVTCLATLGNMRLKISFTRSVFGYLFYLITDSLLKIILTRQNILMLVFAVWPHSGYWIEGSTSSSMLLLCWGKPVCLDKLHVPN